MIYAAILAGGIGKRMKNHTLPKQFIEIDGGIPIIILSMQQFLKNSRIDFVYVAIHEKWIDYARKLFKANFSKNELIKIIIVSGGNERIDSFINIINDIYKKNRIKEEDIIICHDSVRPFVNQKMIDDCINATINDKLALTVVPTTDTIHKASISTSYIDGTINRNGLYNGQTPSGFNLKLLYDALTNYKGDKSKFTGTTQLMIGLGYKIRIVDGNTNNLKITTNNDLNVANSIINSNKGVHNVKILDCTLRDGGIVIDFNFGEERIQSIKKSLEDTGIEYIECGYINENSTSSKEKSSFNNDVDIKNNFLKSGKFGNIKYFAMIDYGTFNFNNLQKRSKMGIDGIRLAFHKKDMYNAINEAKIIISKGYELFIQPMVTTKYSDDEFIELITLCNTELSSAKAFYIVDSFGQFDNMSLLHKLDIADRYVSNNMKIGFHAHNNRQMAFSNALSIISHSTTHDIIIDSSIMGMGKGAGNLCTELIMPKLNYENRKYNINSIHKQISEYFSKIIKTNPWGYCLDFYLSSIYGCTPSYVKIFMKDKRVTTDILIDLLKNIPEEKQDACDKEFAYKYLNDYFGGV